MATYKFRALDTGGRQTEGLLEAESSQEALRKVKEQGLLPVAIELISAASDVPPSASIPPQAEHDVMKLYAFGWKMRLRKLLAFHLPFCLVAGIGFYLFFQGKPTWLVFIIDVGGLITFGIAGVTLNGIVSHEDWLPTLAAAAGAPDIKEKLLKGGVELNGRTCKNHIDGSRR